MLFEHPLDRFPDLFPHFLGGRVRVWEGINAPHLVPFSDGLRLGWALRFREFRRLRGLRRLRRRGEGKASAPQRDWQASRLGPMPPESMATIRKDAFEAVLAACRTPPSLFVDSDGTSQHEAVRRWHLGAVLPLAKLLEHELTMKLETPVELKFDSYALDMVFAGNRGRQARASGRSNGDRA